jgi:RNA polymerase sigma-70 factor (ECF subfamily)
MAVPETPAPGPTVEESATRADLDRAARAVLVTLPPADVEAILAHVGEALRPALPAATFRKRVERALKRLRRAWSEKHGTL